MEESSTPVQTKNLSRRELLKTLAATGSALAASTIMPAEWVKPVIQAGVVPAHAQATGCCVTIDRLGIVGNPGPEGMDFQLHYKDCECGVDSSTIMYISISGCDNINLNGLTLGAIGATITPEDECGGLVNFHAGPENCSNEPGQVDSIDVCVALAMNGITCVPFCRTFIIAQ